MVFLDELADLRCDAGSLKAHLLDHSKQLHHEISTTCRRTCHKQLP